MKDSNGINPKDSVGTQKAGLSAVPFPVLWELGVAMQEGAMKYGRHNYRAVKIRGSVYFDAVMRHVTTWWEGEDVDPESGLNHITKAIASLVVLREAMIRDQWVDDRPPKSNVELMRELNKVVEGLCEKYPDPVRPYTEVDKSWIGSTE